MSVTMSNGQSFRITYATDSDDSIVPYAVFCHGSSFLSSSSNPSIYSLVPIKTGTIVYHFRIKNEDNTEDMKELLTKTIPQLLKESGIEVEVTTT